MGPGSASATVSRPVLGSGPTTPSSLEPLGVDSWFERMTAKHGGLDVGGEWIERPWDLVTKNGAHLERDFAAAGKAGVSNRHLAKLALVGPVDRLWIHETARIDPYTVFDTTNGPIILGPNVWVQPFSRIEGPVLDRRRLATLSGESARLCLDRAQLPDRRRGRGRDRARSFQQISRGFPRPRLYRRVGQPGGDHVQQRSAQRLRRGFRPPARRPGADGPGQGRLLHRRPHADRDGEHAQHGHGDRRHVQRLAGGNSPAQTCAVVHGRFVRPGRAGLSLSTSFSRRPGP